MSPRTISEQIYNHAIRLIAPFASDTGAAWAAVPTGPLTHEAWPLASLEFRNWLAHGFFAEHGLCPSESSLDFAVRLIQARARYGAEQPRRDVFTRIGWRGIALRPDTLTIDLASPSREIVEINAHGWRSTTNETWSFRPIPGALPLPRPAYLSDSVTPLVDVLRDLLPLPAAALHRLAIWLFAALRPAGPYPILILTGPPSSGKSTIARILRSLIDPNLVPLQTLPKSERELFVLSLHHRVLAFDHVPSLTHDLSVALARLASGSAFTRNGHHPFDAPMPFTVERPVILTVPYSEARAAHWNRNRTIASLALPVQIDAIMPDRQRTKHDLAGHLEFVTPAALTALYTAASASLAASSANDATATVPVSRFVDLQQSVTAAAPALGLSREDVNAALSSSPLIAALTNSLTELPDWTGTPTDLLAALTAEGATGLPANARSLAQQLNATPLALYGINYSTERRMDARLIHLAMTHALKFASCLAKSCVMDSMKS